MQSTELNPELPTVGGFGDTERAMLESWLDAECPWYRVRSALHGVMPVEVAEDQIYGVEVIQ